MSVLTEKQSNTLPVLTEGPNESRFRFVSFILLWWFLGLGVAFHKSLGDLLITVLHPEVAKGIMVAAVLSVGSALIYKSVEIVKALFNVADKEVHNVINRLSLNVVSVSEEVAVIREVSAVQANTLSSLSSAVQVVSSNVDKIVAWNDETKMRYQSFEDDWVLLREDLEALGDANILRAARILKDCVRDFTSGACSVSFNGDQAIFA